MDNTTYTFFIIELKERRPEIADFLLRCERNHLTVEDYTAMRHSMRRLVELSCNRHTSIYKLALIMQEAIQPGAMAAHINLLSLCRTLLSACHEALISIPGATQAIGIGKIFFDKKPLLISVDDDRIVHHMIEGMFGDHITVLTARNGVEGLAQIRRHRPDLVVLDDAMPQMSGMTLIETLHADAELSTIPVVMLTSSDRPKDIERAMAAGAADYVIKPFNPKKLSDAVYRALGVDIAS